MTISKIVDNKTIEVVSLFFKPKKKERRRTLLICIVALAEFATYGSINQEPKFDKTDDILRPQEARLQSIERNKCQLH